MPRGPKLICWHIVTQEGASESLGFPSNTIRGRARLFKRQTTNMSKMVEVEGRRGLSLEVPAILKGVIRADNDLKTYSDLAVLSDVGTSSHFLLAVGKLASHKLLLVVLLK